ncbi:hypothetical protein LN994_003986 [Salmonella enterica]|nr:hypothetical protein [Salmonella enterica subsp. enterica]EDV0774424.1 hypothetical protein [Salmonella enterica subsp. enterica]EIN0011226.1 hypothetical protein [Salmonella enterica]EJP6694715.1 hypothetical protein [Salmonella enterica]EME6384560.1 hypothetical protein [Salmonella enterica]
MSEFHRWQGEKLKEDRRDHRRRQKPLILALMAVLIVLAIVELLLVVWIMSDGNRW